VCLIEGNDEAPYLYYPSETALREICRKEIDEAVEWSVNLRIVILIFVRLDVRIRTSHTPQLD
jgi:hypothetical protein